MNTGSIGKARKTKNKQCELNLSGVSQSTKIASAATKETETSPLTTVSTPTTSPVQEISDAVVKRAQCIIMTDGNDFTSTQTAKCLMVKYGTSFGDREKNQNGPSSGNSCINGSSITDTVFKRFSPVLVAGSIKDRDLVDTSIANELEDIKQKKHVLHKVQSPSSRCRQRHYDDKSETISCSELMNPQEPFYNNTVNLGHRSPVTEYSNVAGGRLQFFKDGKFILELAQAGEGEKPGWISVPRKIYWPPSGCATAAVNSSKNESSTSLSFSDDNSSIQSSPWQRDHIWKQATPRRNISKEMDFLFIRSGLISLRGLRHTGRKKRRRPFDSSKLTYTKDIIKKANMENSDLSTQYANTNLKFCDDGTRNSVAGTKDSCKKDNIIDLNNKKDSFETKADQRSRSRKFNPRISLCAILQILVNKVPVTANTVRKKGSISSTSSGCAQQLRLAETQHYHQQHISPRKRILRELEKVSLEENCNNNSSSKRSRAKHNSSLRNTSRSPHYSGRGTSPSSGYVGARGNNLSLCINFSKSNSSSSKEKVSNETNGSCQQYESEISNPPPKRLYSSYSIHSLLGNSSGTHQNSSSRSAEEPEASALLSSGSSSRTTSKPKDTKKPSYLRTMLRSPQSPSEQYKSSGSSITSALITRDTNNFSPSCGNIIRKQEFYQHNQLYHVPQRQTTECPSKTADNAASSYTRESQYNPDKCLLKKVVKTISANNIPASSSLSSGFHPYLSLSAAPKHVSSVLALNAHALPSNSSPNQHLSITQLPASNSYHRETSVSSGKIHSSEISRTRAAPKKSTAMRGHFLSPVSSPNTNHAQKLSVEPKSKFGSSLVNDNQEVLRTTLCSQRDRGESPSNHLTCNTETAALHSTIAASEDPSTSLYYSIYPGNQHVAAASYIPTLPYYHPIAPYAAAVAALRHSSLWMHYPSPHNVIASTDAVMLPPQTPCRTLSPNIVGRIPSTYDELPRDPEVSATTALTTGLKGAWTNSGERIENSMPQDLRRISPPEEQYLPGLLQQ